MTSSSSLTSPVTAIATPSLRSMRRTHAFAASAERSLQATLAPYLASASAIPLPMFGPAPVTSATFPASEISICASLFRWPAPGRCGAGARAVEQASSEWIGDE